MAARAAFAGSGFAGATIRSIAAEAGVDPALVHHYFGSKADLFMASLALPIDPRDVLAPVVAGPRAEAGVALVRALLLVWDDPEMQLQLVALARSAMQRGGEQLLTQGFIPVVIDPVLAQLVVDRPEVRIPLVASQVVGLIVTRYLLAMPAMAAMAPEELAARVGPTIQRYLTGELT